MRIHYIQLRIKLFKEVKTILKKNDEFLQTWFYENHITLNSGKCPFLIINKDIAKECTELGETTLHAEVEEKPLGIIIDKDLNSQSHRKSILKTANPKLSALVRVPLCITDCNKKVMFNSFIKRQFNYCPFC